MAEKLSQPGQDVNPEMLKAFEAMWYHFPSPVFLLLKNRTIIGLNKAAKDLGVMTGMKCFQLSGKTGIHENCLGNDALKEGTGKRAVGYVPDLKQVMDSYWVPVVGEPNLMIHFAIDITEYAKPEMFPSPE